MLVRCMLYHRLYRLFYRSVLYVDSAFVVLHGVSFVVSYGVCCIVWCIVSCIILYCMLIRLMLYRLLNCLLNRMIMWCSVNVVKQTHLVPTQTMERTQVVIQTHVIPTQKTLALKQTRLPPTPTLIIPINGNKAKLLYYNDSFYVHTLRICCTYSPLEPASRPLCL